MAQSQYYTWLYGKLTSFLTRYETASEFSLRRLGKPGARPVIADPVKEYEHLLTTAVSEQGCAIAGQVQLVNLAEIAEHFGARWPSVKKRVHFIIDRILSRNMSDADYYVRQGDDKYHLLFSGLSESDAQTKCALLTREIFTELLGEGAEKAGKADLAGLDIRSAIVRIGSPLPPEGMSLDAVDRLVITKQAENVQDALAPADLKSLPKAGMMGLFSVLEGVEDDLKRWQEAPQAPEDEQAKIIARLEGVGQLLRQGERAVAGHFAGDHPSDQSNTLEGPPPGTGEPPGVPRQTDQKWKLFHNLPRLLRQTLAKVETQLEHHVKLFGMGGAPVPPLSPAPKPAEERPPFDWSKAEVVFSYLPMWQVKKKAINSYLCQLALTSGGEIHPIEALFDEKIDETVIASLDRLVLRKALQDIHLLIKSGRPNNIVVPVHYPTLMSSRARQEYLGCAAQVRPELLTYLIWELTDTLLGMSNQPARQAAALLKPYGRAILLRVRLEDRHFDELAGAGIYAIGASLVGTVGGEAKVIHMAETFKARAERSGLRAYLHGVRSLSLATAAVCAGFEHIDGDAIAQAIGNPLAIQSYRIESPYAHILSSPSPAPDSPSDAPKAAVTPPPHGKAPGHRATPSC